MTTGFIERLTEALKRSQFWTEKTRTSNSSIQGLVCPACGDTEAWAYVRSPMSINCNRANNCGAKTKTLELFPELRRNIELEFPPIKGDSDRPVKEFLKSRGIEKALQGLEFYYLKNVRNCGSGAVMFPIGKDKNGKKIENGRLLNPPKGVGKTHNIGSTSGKFWSHPGFEYNHNQTTFITEGIIDALSLIEMGQQAIAVLSSGQQPDKVDLALFPRITLSFDNDESGWRACRKWKSHYPEAEVILCDPGSDWNDLLQSWSPDTLNQQFRENLPRFRANGELAMAETASSYGEIYYKSFGYPPSLFNFWGETFYASLKSPRGTDQEPYVSVTRCLRATIKVISYIIDRTNPCRPEYFYNLEVKSSQKGRKPIEIIGTGKNIATARSLNEYLLSAAKIPWEGDTRATTALQSKITSDTNAPEVAQLSVIGYQPDSRAYVFHHWAIDQAGNLIEPDSRGLFKIAHNQRCRPPGHSEGKSIAPAGISRQRLHEIHNLMLKAWGLNAAIALSWTVAGWFVNQIKEQIGFFPFLSMHGDPASGKSAIVTLLNHLQGIDEEGLPINQINSKKGSIRTIGQRSGIFTALLEDNERNERGWDYSIILTAYNRGPLQVQAAFSNDLQTRTNLFLGTLLFCQNSEPFNSKAEKQRVISILFRSETITDETRHTYETITSLPKTEIAGVIQQVLVNRSYFEENWFKEYEIAMVDLGPMAERRILDNHALILAFYRLFCRLFGLPEDSNVFREIEKIGNQKCITSSIRQTTIADHFFELLDTIEDEKAATAFHIDKIKKQILVNLPRTENHLRNKGLNFQANESLQQALQQHPSFIRNGLTYRFPHDPEIDDSGKRKVRKVWVFSLDWFEKNYRTAIECATE